VISYRVRFGVALAGGGGRGGADRGVRPAARAGRGATAGNGERADDFSVTIALCDAPATLSICCAEAIALRYHTTT
jgi:hypothetical protein